MMVKYRPHKGLLDDAMAEMKTFSSANEMLDFVANQYSDYLSKEDLSIGEDLGRDQRIGWAETRYVCTRRFGGDHYEIPQCIGMCSFEREERIK